MKYTPQLMNLDALYRTRRHPHASRWNLTWTATEPAAGHSREPQPADSPVAREHRHEFDDHDDEP